MANNNFLGISLGAKITNWVFAARARSYPIYLIVMQTNGHLTHINQESTCIEEVLKRRNSYNFDSICTCIEEVLKRRNSYNFDCIYRLLHRKCDVRIFIHELQDFGNERVSAANE